MDTRGFPLRTGLIAALLAAGCVQVPEHRENHFTGGTDDVRTRIEDPVLRAVAFPVNLPASMASNFVTALYPGNLWPLQYALLPISATIWGVQDAAQGTVFWSPSALYE